MSAMWQWYAAVAMVCFAAMQLLFKQLTRLGMTPAHLLCGVFLFGSAFFLVHVLLARTPSVPVDRTFLGLLAVTGGLGYVGNLCAVRALALAPNPGYSTAIVGVQALVVTLAAAMFAGVALSGVKVAGVLLCVAGVVLLVL
jgi:drug/metabolite transporter (DMT)-like permease